MTAETRVELDVFGGRSTILVGGSAPDGTPAQLAATRAAARLRLIHRALTRFEPDSELSRLNADPRWAVPASTLLRRVAQAVREAGELSGGLVDGTVLPALREAGYVVSRVGAAAAEAGPEDLAAARAALPDPRARWREVRVEGGAIVRPPGVELDGGGLVKGLACDLIARDLGLHPLFAIDCSGDLRLGGTSGRPREVSVADPLGRGAPARWTLVEGAAATSGVTRRAWRDAEGRLAHHLIDPGRGVPASTGVLQATALAPTALEAEVRAKAALLAGPEAGLEHLVHGGVLVLADGRVLHARAEERAAA